MDLMPELEIPDTEPMVITKPDSPFYLSPKFLIPGAVLIVLFASIGIFSLIKLKSPSPNTNPASEIAEANKPNSAVGKILSTDTNQQMLLVADEFGKGKISVYVIDTTIITKQEPFKKLPNNQKPKGIVSASEGDNTFLVAESSKVNFNDLKSGVRIQINADIGIGKKWVARDINII